MKGEVTSATAPSSPQVSRHPIFSSAENVISGRGGRPWEEETSTVQTLSSLFFSPKTKASSIDCARVSRSLKRLLQQLQQGHPALKDLQWTRSQRLGAGRKSLHHSKD